MTIGGFVGISCWHTSTSLGKSTLSGTVATDISLIRGVSISTTSDSASENAKDNGAAHGIFILGNSLGGSISMTLDNGSISAERAGTVISAGIRIENFSGPITITLRNNSSISTTNENAANNSNGNNYGIYLSSCPNATIEVDGTSSVSGTNGAVYFSNSTVNGVTYSSYSGDLPN